jgi:hypothetical protein
MVSGRSRRRGEGASGPRQRVGSRHGQPYVGVAGQDCGRSRCRGRRSCRTACVEDAIAGWRRYCSGDHAYVSPNPWLQPKKASGRIRLAVAQSTINRRLPYPSEGRTLGFENSWESRRSSWVLVTIRRGPPWELIGQRDRPLKRGCSGLPWCRAANPLLVLRRFGAGIVVQKGRLVRLRHDVDTRLGLLPPPAEAKLLSLHRDLRILLEPYWTSTDTAA